MFDGHRIAEDHFRLAGASFSNIELAFPRVALVS